VTQDALGLSIHRPKFVPTLADIAAPLREAYAKYVRAVVNGEYPSPEHDYAMSAPERDKLVEWLKQKSSF
jgi:ketopantoate hydroxymethyltransferase